MELKVEKLDLAMVDISGSILSKVNAEGVQFDNVNLAKSNINNTNMSGMAMNDVNMSESKITNANLSGTAIQDANFSHCDINHVHLFGTEFTNIVLPHEGDLNYSPEGRYKPVIFRNSNLTNMEIIDCDITGLKIYGVLIEELLKEKGE
jgi:uncharacterized protein YjbI with pentapeptide repeats